MSTDIKGVSLKRRGFDPSEEWIANNPHNPLMEPMFDQCTCVLFNVRGKMTWGEGKEKLNAMLMRAICTNIIRRLEPIQDCEILSSRFLCRLENIALKHGGTIPSVHRMLASVESCFRIATLSIPPKYLGTVFFNSDMQTLEFVSEGVFEDDVESGVYYFDDVEPKKGRQIDVPYFSDPEWFEKIKMRNHRIAEEDTQTLDGF